MAIDPSASLPAFRDYHRQLAAGAPDVGQAAVKAEYALVHLHRVLANGCTERFRTSLGLVAGR